LDELLLNKQRPWVWKTLMQKTAIIIGTGGIGCALSDKLESDGTASVQRLGRNSAIAIDLTDEGTISAAAENLANDGVRPDLVIVATGLLHRAGKGPEKALRELDPEWMLENYRINAVGPALIAKHFLPLMPRDRRTVFAVLSARVGSISDNKLGGWHSYRASKAALNMLIRNLSIEWQRKNPLSIIVGLHPGTVETALSAPFKGNPATERFTPDKAASQLLGVLAGLNPEQSGQLFAFDGQLIAP
jgi:NAD(P)-dependent dehydrogenase (short-subunit alcohol dehydrogenase family)